MTMFFVYNAESDLPSKAFGVLHKIISPNTYACDLCKLSHGNFGKRSAWKKFLDELDFETKVFYRNEFENHCPTLKFIPPFIAVSTNNKLEILLSATEMKEKKNVEELIHGIQSKLLLIQAQ